MLIIFAIAILVFVVLSYPIGIGYFGGYQFVFDPKAWADFSTYVGGLTGPLLSAFALVYIANTFKSQRESVEFERLNVKIMILKEALDRQYKSIESNFEYDYKKSGVSVKNHFYEILNKELPKGKDEQDLAYGMLVYIAEFIRNYDYYSDCIQKLNVKGEEYKIENFVKVSFVDQISPKITLFEAFVDNNRMTEEHRKLLSRFKTS
ncbi:hypothetical protein [Vibrio vulnificus]|uniref:hypothetical protein n=1 Tax=Vibrio vulnificus TaxID=672 RepID=UPI00405959CD